jgi:hypothetical protein
MKGVVSFDPVATNTDGTPVVGPVAYFVLIDTVNPPLQRYAVPPAVAAAPVNGRIVATFAEIGFTPTAKTAYYAEALARDANGTESSPSASITFTWLPTPNAPANFSIA